MKIMISGHGGRYQATGKTKVLPNVTVNFFVNDSITLSNDRTVKPNAWSIYDDWSTVNAPVSEAFQAGQDVYDYYCWEMVDATDGAGTNAASGIFDEKKNKIQTLQAEAKAEQLSTLMPILTAKYPNEKIEIYWAACRTIS